MRSYPYHVLDAFTHTRFAGNPAGVVLQDGTLTDAQMRSVAGELRLESAFLTPLTEGDADYRVCYYTGVCRVPLCGHDTIAAAVLLAQTVHLPGSGMVRFATDVGVISVQGTGEGRAVMEQALPLYGAEANRKEVAAALGVDPGEVIGTPQVVSTGSPFLFVPVRTRVALNALRPDAERLAAFVATLGCGTLGAYVWTGETVDPANRVHARCFAPSAGLPEDPVTGSASGALGAYLLRHGLAHPDAEGVLAFATEQGHAMGRPGQAQVHLEMRGEEVIRVTVGGESVLVAEGRIWV